MKKETSFVLVRLLFVSIFLFSAAITAYAKEGFYLSLGVANQSASGDLDGKKSYANDSTSPTEVILVGKLSAGNGYTIGAGYGLNPHVALDVLYSSTSHESDHDFIISGDNTSAAELSTLLMGVKLFVPISESQLLSFRLGISSCTLEYEDFSLIGYKSGSEFVFTDQKSVEYLGSGYGAGLGYEYIFDKIGLEINYIMHSVDFNEAKASKTSGSLPEDIKATISTINAMLVYHF